MANLIGKKFSNNEHPDVIVEVVEVNPKFKTVVLKFQDGATRPVSITTITKHWTEVGESTPVVKEEPKEEPKKAPIEPKKPAKVEKPKKDTPKAKKDAPKANKPAKTENKVVGFIAPEYLTSGKTDYSLVISVLEALTNAGITYHNYSGTKRDIYITKRGVNSLDLYVGLKNIRIIAKKPIEHKNWVNKPIAGYVGYVEFALDSNIDDIISVVKGIVK